MLRNFYPDIWRRLMVRGRMLSALAAVCVSIAFYLASARFGDDQTGYLPFMTVFGYSILALLFAVAVMAALSPSSPISRVRIPGAYHLALWSYSIRKFGGRCVLGFQSIAQVRGTYGDAEAQTIVENCGNTLILRCSASERGGTAEFASRLIGKREVIRQQSSLSRPARWGGAGRQTRTLSEHHAVEDAVMASEIEQLPDLGGFLKVASEPEWRRVTVSRS